jgi:hypothetical protein
MLSNAWGRPSNPWAKVYPGQRQWGSNLEELVANDQRFVLWSNPLIPGKKVLVVSLDWERLCRDAQKQWEKAVARQGEQ